MSASRAPASAAIPDCRLYLLSPPLVADAARFAAQLASALEGGDVACFQLRLKSPAGARAPDEVVLAVAKAITPVLRSADVHFLINDRPDLALKAGADGVHIGQDDMRLPEARAMLGAEATIGVTCHDSYHLAMEAGEAGADYVAFGAFFPTGTKAAAASADPDLIARWTCATIVPCVAIGGITPQNCGSLVAAGAEFIAASSAVWDHPSGPRAAVAAFNAAIGAVVR